MLGPVEAKFFTWAADKLFDLADLDKSRAEACRVRVANYFRSIADCLSRMSRDLIHKKIPREDGNYLKELIKGFEFAIASNFYGRHNLGKKDVKEWLSDLKQAAANAENLDYSILEGKVESNPGYVHNKIAEIERTAGRFRGISTLLEATVPFSKRSKKNTT